LLGLGRCEPFTQELRDEDRIEVGVHSVWRCKWADGNCETVHSLSDRTSIQDAALLGGGKYLYGRFPETGHEGIYDFETGKSICEVEGRRTFVALAPDGKVVAIADPRTRSSKIIDGSSGSVRTATFGHILAIANDASLTFEGGIVFDPVSDRQIFRVSQHLISSAAFSPDTRTLATGAYDGTVWLSNVATGQLIARFETQSCAVHALHFSSDSRKLAALTLTSENRWRLFIWSGDSDP
jgi:WD40 repeat protein